MFYRLENDSALTVGCIEYPQLCWLSPFHHNLIGTAVFGSNRNIVNESDDLPVPFLSHTVVGAEIHSGKNDGDKEI